MSNPFLDMIVATRAFQELLVDGLELPTARELEEEEDLSFLSFPAWLVWNHIGIPISYDAVSVVVSLRDDAQPINLPRD